MAWFWILNKLTRSNHRLKVESKWKVWEHNLTISTQTVFQAASLDCSPVNQPITKVRITDSPISHFALFVWTCTSRRKECRNHKHLQFINMKVLEANMLKTGARPKLCIVMNKLHHQGGRTDKKIDQNLSYSFVLLAANPTSDNC